MYCSSCGKEISKESKFCRHCGAELQNGGVKISEELKETKAESEIYSENSISTTEVRTNFKIASANRRLANLFLDSIGVYVFAIIVGFLGAILFGSGVFDNVDERFLGFGLYFFYYFLFESIFSKSPAKFITKTRVLRSNREKANVGQIFGRTLCRFIPFEFLTFLTPKDGPIGWHDKLANTIVVHED